MELPFEDEMADGFEEGEGFEGEGFEDAMEADGMEGSEGEGFEGEGFEGEGFEDELDETRHHHADEFEGEGFDEGEGFEEGFDEGEGFEESMEGAEDAEGAVELAFADAMLEEDEDAFFARLRQRLGGFLRNPLVRQIARRALPMAQQLARQASPQYGGLIASGLGGLGRLAGITSMDLFADLAADADESEMDEFLPVAAGLAARQVLRGAAQGARRLGRPATRTLSQQIQRAAQAAARQLVRRFGARALRVLPRIVRWTTRILRQRRMSPRAAPAMIRRAAARLTASPRAAARLARPVPAVRRVRAQAGLQRIPPRGAPVRRGGVAPTPAVGASRRLRPVPGRPGTFALTGPAWITLR